MKINKQHIIFVIVCLLLIAAIVYRTLNPFVQKTTDQLTYKGKPNQSKKAIVHKIDKSEKNTPQSIVSKFLNKPSVSGNVHQNLFSIYQKPVEIGESVKNGSVAQPEIMPTQKDLLVEARNYITSYKLYGEFKEGDKKAVFLSKDKLVLVARIGDRIDGKYQIEDIQDTRIKINVLELNEIIHLDMREFNNE